MKVLASASLALIGALTIAVGMTGQPSALAEPAHHDRGSCFWTRDVNNFAASDDTNLYIRVGVRDVYHLTLFSNCMDIGWVHHLALRTHTSGDICEGHNPDLDVIAPEVGLGRQRCPVVDVRKLTPEQAAALPKDARP